MRRSLPTCPSAPSHPHRQRREGGWAGVAFSRAQPWAVACARGCARDITLFDGAGARVRTMHTVSQPYALTFLPEGGHSCCGGGSVLAAAEGHVVSGGSEAQGGGRAPRRVGRPMRARRPALSRRQLALEPAAGRAAQTPRQRPPRRAPGGPENHAFAPTPTPPRPQHPRQVSIWDARAGERGGCMQRVAAATAGSPLYTLAWCSGSGGLLGAAGAERAVQMVDPRR
jgi:hypothetical protein